LTLTEDGDDYAAALPEEFYGTVGGRPSAVRDDAPLALEDDAPEYRLSLSDSLMI